MPRITGTRNPRSSASRVGTATVSDACAHSAKNRDNMRESRQHAPPRIATTCTPWTLSTNLASTVALPCSAIPGYSTRSPGICGDGVCLDFPREPSRWKVYAQSATICTSRKRLGATGTLAFIVGIFLSCLNPLLPSCLIRRVELRRRNQVSG